MQKTDFQLRRESNITEGMPKTYICVCGHLARSHSLYRQSHKTPSAPHEYKYYRCYECKCPEFESEYDRTNAAH